MVQVEVCELKTVVSILASDFLARIETTTL